MKEHKSQQKGVPEILDNLELLRKSIEQDKAILVKTGTKGRTLLHHAVLHKKPEACEVLLEQGANPDAQDEDGNTPGHLEAYSALGSIVFLSKLIKKSVNFLKLPNNQGNTITEIIPYPQNVGLSLFLELIKAQNIELLKSWLTKPIPFESILQNIINSSFSWAIETENCDLVELLLQNGGNANYEDYNRGLLLTFVPNVKMAELLVRYGAKVNQDSNLGMPLHHVKNAEVAKFLLDNGAREYINLRDKWDKKEAGFTPLYHAVSGSLSSPDPGWEKYDTSGVVRVLLEYGADVDIVNLHGWMALYEAFRQKNLEIFKLLFAKSNGSSVIKILSADIFQNQVDVNNPQTKEMVLLLLKEWAKTDIEKWELEGSVKDEELNINYILQNKPASDDISPLHIAIHIKCTESIQILASKDPNILDAGGCPPLALAIKDNNIQITEILLQAGANPNLRFSTKKFFLLDGIEHYTILTFGIDKMKGDDVKILKLLLENRATVDGSDAGKLRPIHKAVENNNIKAAKLLIDAGAILEIPYKGKTPLSMAIATPGAEAEAMEMVKLLVEEGKVRLLDLKGRPAPLALAGKKGYLEVMKYLINHGSPLHKVDKAGLETIDEFDPLILALRGGASITLIALLLAEDKNINISASAADALLFSFSVKDDEPGRSIKLKATEIRATENLNLLRAVTAVPSIFNFSTGSQSIDDTTDTIYFIEKLKWLEQLLAGNPADSHLLKQVLGAQLKYYFLDRTLFPYSGLREAISKSFTTNQELKIIEGILTQALEEVENNFWALLNPIKFFDNKVLGQVYIHLFKLSPEKQREFLKQFKTKLIQNGLPEGYDLEKYKTLLNKAGEEAKIKLDPSKANDLQLIIEHMNNFINEESQTVELLTRGLMVQLGVDVELVPEWFKEKYPEPEKKENKELESMQAIDSASVKIAGEGFLSELVSRGLELHNISSDRLRNITEALKNFIENAILDIGTKTKVKKIQEECEAKLTESLLEEKTDVNEHDAENIEELINPGENTDMNVECAGQGIDHES